MRLVRPCRILLVLESRGETNTDAAAARRPAVRQSSSGLQRLKIAQAGFLTGATHHITHVAEQQRKTSLHSAPANQISGNQKYYKKYYWRAVCEEGLLQGFCSDTVRTEINPHCWATVQLSWLCFHCNSGCRPVTNKRNRKNMARFRIQTV